MPALAERRAPRPDRRFTARLAAADSYSELPPLFKKPTVLGWFFFARSSQCWRGFRAWPRERYPCEVGVFARADASLFSVFSGCHASVLEATSFAGAGLEVVGCGWRLL